MFWQVEEPAPLVELAKTAARERAEERVNESVAFIHNLQFDQQKSWEECYRELAISLEMVRERLHLYMDELEEKIRQFTPQ